MLMSRFNYLNKFTLQFYSLYKKNELLQRFYVLGFPLKQGFIFRFWALKVMLHETIRNDDF